MPEPTPAAPSTTTTPPATPAPGSTSYTDVRLRELLGLEADADVDAALRELTTNRPDPTAPATPAATTEPTTTTPAPAAPATPAGDLVGAGAVAQLSAGQLAELQRDAAWARDRRRAEALDQAVTTGRITPAERGFLTSELSAAPAGTQVSGFAAAIERDEEGTVSLLGTLSPRFATTELGSGDAPTATADKAFDDFEAATFGLDRSAPAS